MTSKWPVFQGPPMPVNFTTDPGPTIKTKNPYGTVERVGASYPYNQFLRNQFLGIEPFIVDSRLAEGVLQATATDIKLTEQLLLSNFHLPFPRTAIVVAFPYANILYLLQEKEQGISILVWQEDFETNSTFMIPFALHVGPREFVPMRLPVEYCLAAMGKMRVKDDLGGDFQVLEKDMSESALLFYSTVMMIGGPSFNLYFKDSQHRLPYVGITTSDAHDLRKEADVDYMVKEGFIRKGASEAEIIAMLSRRDQFVIDNMVQSIGCVRRVLGILTLLAHTDHVTLDQVERPKGIRLHNRKPLPWLRKRVLKLKVPHEIKEALDTATREPRVPTGRHPAWHSVQTHWFTVRRGDPEHRHHWSLLVADDPKREGCSCGARRTLRAYPQGRGDASIGMVRKTYKVTP